MGNNDEWDGKWDGKSKVWGYDTAELYDSPDDAKMAFDVKGVEDRTVVMCRPIFPRELIGDDFEDEEMDVFAVNFPPEMQVAIDEFNDRVKGIILDWELLHDRAMTV
jgi:hypothetical protein